MLAGTILLVIVPFGAIALLLFYQLNDHCNTCYAQVLRSWGRPYPAITTLWQNA
ncbi:MAG TPA: hypothetical protein VI094_18655 [Propionibacteriaceae bacterium]